LGRTVSIGPPLCLAPQLQEFQAGILTGLTWAEAQQRYPDLCEALETSLDWLPIPQAETPLQGRQRAEAFITQLIRRHRNGDAVWVVAHQWILEHLIAALLGSDRTWQITMPNTALFEFWLDCDRWAQTDMARHTSTLWQIQRFNECPHLLSIAQTTANAAPTAAND
jgi:broad specificity phosphatase PhoE